MCVPTAKIVHDFGRADLVDREGLRRLVRSIRRVLDPPDALAATASGEVSVIDARPMGAADWFTLASLETPYLGFLPR
jgi:hypothetical protein